MLRIPVCKQCGNPVHEHASECTRESAVSLMDRFPDDPEVGEHILRHAADWLDGRTQWLDGDSHAIDTIDGLREKHFGVHFTYPSVKRLD